MILKIESYDEIRQWWMYDNIRKISMSKPRYGSSKSNILHDIIIFNMLTSCDCDEGSQCSKCVKYLVAICTLNDNSEISIAFDTTAYLLNDQGKTIEKVVANYNE